MNRVDFIESVSGIKYPDMLVQFFDHFIALKQIIDDRGVIEVIHNSEKSIKFTISFCNLADLNYALNIIQSNNNIIIIYERPMSITVEAATTDLKLNICIE